MVGKIIVRQIENTFVNINAKFYKVYVRVGSYAG